MRKLVTSLFAVYSHAQCDHLINYDYMSRSISMMKDELFKYAVCNLL